MAELTEKQQKFVEECLKGSNGTRAAIAAGYSPKAATVAASKLMANPNVKKALRKVHDEVIEEIKITKETMIEDIQALSKDAKTANQFSAAMKGKEMVSKMLGFFEIEKTPPQDYNVELTIPDGEEANQ